MLILLAKIDKRGDSMELVLKQVRERRHYTQQQVADMLGVKVATYRTWEQGSVKLTLENAFKVSDVLGCTPNDLCNWYETHPREPVRPADPMASDLVRHFSNLSEEGREVAVNVLAGMESTYPQGDGSPGVVEEAV